MKSLKQCFAWSSIALALVAMSSVVQAQDVDPRAVPIAQKLYEEGAALMDAKKFAEACPKLEQVTRLIPKGIGGHEALGECYEGLGRLASAWGQYVQLEVLAQAAGEKATAAKAHAKVDELKSKLATVKITVPEEMHDVDGLSVSWDGLLQEQGSWGTPIPVDAGKHIIEVKAPTRQTWTREVVVVGDGASMEEKVPVLKMAPVAILLGNGAVVQSTAAPATWMKPVGGVALGVGILGVGLGGVFAGLAKSKLDASNAEGECDAQNWCNATGVGLRQEAKRFAVGADVAVPAGLVFAVGGAVLLGIAPKEKKDSAQKTSLQVDVGPSGIGLRGVWQ